MSAISGSAGGALKHWAIGQRYPKIMADQPPDRDVQRLPRTPEKDKSAAAKEEPQMASVETQTDDLNTGVECSDQTTAQETAKVVKGGAGLSFRNKAVFAKDSLGFRWQDCGEPTAVGAEWLADVEGTFRLY